MVEMSGQTDTKTKRRYFDLASVIEGDQVCPTISGLIPYIRRYGTYVFYRTTYFGPGFSELARLIEPPHDAPSSKPGSSGTDILMGHLEGLLARGVRALVKEEREVSEVCL